MAGICFIPIIYHYISITDYLFLCHASLLSLDALRFLPVNILLNPEVLTDLSAGIIVTPFRLICFSFLLLNLEMKSHNQNIWQGPAMPQAFFCFYISRLFQACVFVFIKVRKAKYLKIGFLFNVLSALWRDPWDIPLHFSFSIIAPFTKIVESLFMARKINHLLFSRFHPKKRY